MTACPAVNTSARSQKAASTWRAIVSMQCCVGLWKHRAVTEARKEAFCKGQGVLSSVLGGRRQICSAPDSSAKMKPCHNR